MAVCKINVVLCLNRKSTKRLVTIGRVNKIISPKNPRMFQWGSNPGRMHDGRVALPKRHVPFSESDVYNP